MVPRCSTTSRAEWTRLIPANRGLANQRRSSAISFSRSMSLLLARRPEAAPDARVLSRARSVPSGRSGVLWRDRLRVRARACPRPRRARGARRRAQPPRAVAARRRSARSPGSLALPRHRAQPVADRLDGVAERAGEQGGAARDRDQLLVAKGDERGLAVAADCVPANSGVLANHGCLLVQAVDRWASVAWCVPDRAVLETGHIPRPDSPIRSRAAVTPQGLAARPASALP